MLGAGNLEAPRGRPGRIADLRLLSVVSGGYTRPPAGLNFRQIRKSLPIFCRRFLPLLILAGFAPLLVGWSTTEPRPSAPPEPTVTLPTDSADPSAQQLLAQAVAALDPDRVHSIETMIWQKVMMNDLKYQAEGRYLSGPDGRFRLDLRTRVNSLEGQYRLISDGQAISQATRIGGEAWKIAKPVELSKLLPTDKTSPALSPDGFVQEPLAGGLFVMVRDLKQNMVWANKETVQRKEKVLYKLTGVWTAGMAREIVPVDKPWPVGTPRLARLYLDVKTLWPHRLEWWGPDPPRSGIVLLMQTEFREPVLNQALSPERCAREFTLEGAPQR